MPQKILICGDVNGRLSELLKKVSALQKKKGKFDILFCVGEFFGKDVRFLEPFISNQKKIDIDTFIISPLPKEYESKIDKNGCQICDNLTFLGNKGVLEMKNKLKIAYLNGIEPDKEDVNDLIQRLRCSSISYNGIDILFTNSWPKNVEQFSNVQLSRGINRSSDICAALEILVHPRYHIIGSVGSFYEREPFKKHKLAQSKMQHFTRFISLGGVKNENNEKYLYAVNVTPMTQMSSEELGSQPKSLTENPFSEIDPYTIIKTKSQQYFFDILVQKSHNNKKLKRDVSLSTDQNDPDNDLSKLRDTKTEDGEDNCSGAKKVKLLTQAGCWFCLGNPQVEKHLLVHIGTECYLAMPKGPLDTRHLLIVTIGHYQSMSLCPPEVLREIKFLMACVKRYFLESQQLGVVFYERNFKANHFQMQAIPISTSKLETCKELFLELADTETGPGSSFCEIPFRSDIRELAKPGIPYMLVELSDNTKLFGVIPKTKLVSFDIQFPRVVLSHRRLLNCPEKVQWKDCVVQEDLEEELANNLARELKPFLGKE